jgi:tetratricopeptide (TPR) repeat protein
LTKRYLYSFFLVAIGRFEEALPGAQRALELDPLSVRVHQHVGATFYYARRYDEAISRYKEALELDPITLRFTKFLVTLWSKRDSETTPLTDGKRR